MIVKIDKSLEKDVNKIQDKLIRKKLAHIISILQQTDKLYDIPNIRKIKGTNIYYRIRIGDYRLGLIIEHNQIEIIRLLHRKEIYRYFP